MCGRTYVPSFRVYPLTWTVPDPDEEDAEVDGVGALGVVDVELVAMPPWCEHVPGPLLPLTEPSAQSVGPPPLPGYGIVRVRGVGVGGIDRAAVDDWD